MSQEVIDGSKKCGTTTVYGGITFESGKGIVVMGPGSCVQGEVKGGRIVKG